MKIYHKQNFLSGLLMLLLSAGNLVLSFKAGRTPGVFTWLVLIAGAICIYRSLSSKLSRQDKLDALDERNQYVLLKAKSKAFQIVQYGSLALMALFFLMGATADPNQADLFISMAMGFGAAFSLAFFADFFTYLYYEKHI